MLAYESAAWKHEPPGKQGSSVCMEKLCGNTIPQPGQQMNQLLTDMEAEQAASQPVFDFDEAADTCGLTGMQRPFVRAILRGANKTQAARMAGYSGSDEQLRSAGYKAFNSPKVQAFLMLAKRKDYGLPDEPGDADELKRLLWKHARGDDKNHAIRAAEVLHRIEKEEAAAKSDQHDNPIAVLEQIARHSPELAEGLAKERGIDWTPPDIEHARRCPTCQRYLVPGEVRPPTGEPRRTATSHKHLPSDALHRET